jgi:hypothetical protein
MRSPKVVVTVAAVILVAAACGGSSAGSSGAGASAPVPPQATTTTVAPTTAPTTTPSDATTATTSASQPAGSIALCSLLSAADLKAATGADYGDGVLDDYGMCTWRVGGASVNNGDGQVIVGVQDVPLDTFKGTFPGGVDMTVSGHAGYWNPDQGLQSIWVDIGGRTLVISFDPVDPDGQAIAQKVAEIAIGKI